MSNKTKTNLYLEILKPQTNLSYRTKETYYKKLRDLEPNPTNLNFLSDVERILSKFESGSMHVRKSYLSAICAMLKYYDGKKTKKLEKAYIQYRKLLSDINGDISKTTNVLSNDKKENWISKDDITSKQRLYKRRFNKIMNKDYKDISDDEYDTVLEYLILSLYTQTPPRRDKDYFLMFVNTDIEDLNSLDTKNKQFIFREYKDKRALGVQIIPIPKDLYDIIQKYLNLVKSRFKNKDGEALNEDAPIKFLVKSSGKFILRGDIRLILSRIFGKKVGVNSMRRTYATEEFKPTMDKMKKSAHYMGTSVREVRTNYIKENAPKE
jgi:integrase